MKNKGQNKLHFTLIFSLVSCISFAQTILYQENFNTNSRGFYQSPTKNITGQQWDVSCSSCKTLTTGDYFGTVSNYFSMADVDNEYTWTSNNISISGFSNITINLDLKVGSGTHSSHNWDIYYQIHNGTTWGSEVLIGNFEVHVYSLSTSANFWIRQMDSK